jgi:molybdenum cofactor cytidylyltransferase
MTARDEPVVGTLLAAGRGERFGDGNKLLQEVDGDPIVVHAARTLTESSVETCLAVLGHEAERVGVALQGMPLQTTVNTQYKRGQATSVVRAVSWAERQEAGALLIALGDMPWVRVQTCEALIEGWHDGHDVVVPTFEGDRGNPVIFDASLFGELGAVAGDSGGRQLFAEHDVHRIAVDDEGVRRDVDRPEDLPG